VIEFIYKGLGMFGIFSKKQSSVKVRKANGWGDGQAVLSAIDDGVIAIDADGNIRLINQAAESIIGWNSGDAIGLVYDSVLRIVDKDKNAFEREKNPIRKALLDFKCFNSRELFLKTQGGKDIPVFMRINAIDEQHSGLVVVFRNIAKEIEENREQTEFISTASHEMRTPVASIEGYLGLALNPATATIDDRARNFLQKAHENTRHLGQLFQDLLDITRAEDGRLKNDPVVLDAVEFSRNIWEGLKAKAKEKGLNYIFDLDSNKSGEKMLSPVYFIRADRDHLQEVLDNLFDNAIKYTPQGEVSVSVSGDNENVRISVKDSGIGIPAEDIPHLFQKFYRVDTSETREIGGTGLGLFLSRKLVESMDGKLDVTSEYQKGSVFTVQLPRLTREQAEKFKSEEQLKVAKPEVKDEIFGDGISFEDNQLIKSIQQANPVEQPKPQEIITESFVEAAASDQELASEVPPAQAPDLKTDQAPARYSSQEEAIRNYQLQQYYAKQKAAADAQMRERLRQNHQPAIATPQPTTPAPQPVTPTLSDIEKMREAYVQKMMAERQNARK
jgi:PAS domain S-box-containing protein